MFLHIYFFGGTMGLTIYGLPCIWQTTQFYFRKTFSNLSIFLPHKGTLTGRRFTLNCEKLTRVANLSEKELNEGWSQNWIQIFSFLKKPNYASRYNLKRIFNKLSPENLKFLLNKTADAIAKKPDSIDVNQLLKMIRLSSLEASINQQAYILAKNNIRQYPEKNENQDHLKTIDKATVFWRFIPNFIDTFLKAFNILEVGKRPESVWDYSALIAIYVTTLSFPTGIYQLVQPLVVSAATAYCITGGVVLLALATLYVYVKYLRPLPENLPNCIAAKNLTGPVFADREADIAKILNWLEGGLNVLVKGDSGTGKSSLVTEIAKRIKVKKMQKIKDDVFENSYLSPVEKISIDIYEAESYPKTIVFYIDEFDKITAFENLVKFLQEKLEKKQFQVIGTCETTHFEKLRLKYPELIERFMPYELSKPTKNELVTILHAYYNQIQGEFDCADPIRFFEYIIDITEKHKEKINFKSEPRRVIKVWELVLSKLREFSIDEYQSEELKQKKIELNAKKCRYPFLPIKKQNELDQEIVTLQDEVKQLSQNCVEERKKMREMKRLFQIKYKLGRQREEDSRNVLEENNIEAAKRLLYNSYFLIEKVKERIDSIKLPESVQLQIDERVADVIFKTHFDIEPTRSA